MSFNILVLTFGFHTYLAYVTSSANKKFLRRSQKSVQPIRIGNSLVQSQNQLARIAHLKTEFDLSYVRFEFGLTAQHCLNGQNSNLT